MRKELFFVKSCSLKVRNEKSVNTFSEILREKDSEPPARNILLLINKTPAFFIFIQVTSEAINNDWNNLEASPRGTTALSMQYPNH